MDKILVVDDEADMTELIAMVLDGEDMAVLTASDGVEALGIAREERPRLVLTDIMMPHMDGVELCRRLREEPGTRDTAVLLMSAARRMDTSGCCAVGMIRKPFDLQELSDTVRRHLSATPLSV
jgi:CheY-like chemotaxis protein